jgi:hypothetical protein
MCNMSMSHERGLVRRFEDEGLSDVQFGDILVCLIPLSVVVHEDAGHAEVAKNSGVLL